MWVACALLSKKAFIPLNIWPLLFFKFKIKIEVSWALGKLLKFAIIKIVKQRLILMHVYSVFTIGSCH